MKRSFDDDWSWRTEKEPAFSAVRHAPRLDSRGTLQAALGIIPLAYQAVTIEKSQLCEVCEKWVGDKPGRCARCERTDARAVDCDCGFLRAGEQCGCGA